VTAPVPANQAAQADAHLRAQIIRNGLETAGATYAKAVAKEDWRTLGCGSVAEWGEAEFGEMTFKPAVRRQIATLLADTMPGITQREIATATGSSQATVSRDLAGRDSNESPASPNARQQAAIERETRRKETDAAEAAAATEYLEKRILEPPFKWERYRETDGPPAPPLPRPYAYVKPESEDESAVFESPPPKGSPEELAAWRERILRLPVQIEPDDDEPNGPAKVEIRDPKPLDIRLKDDRKPKPLPGKVHALAIRDEARRLIGLLDGWEPDRRHTDVRTALVLLDDLAADIAAVLGADLGNIGGE
jgi:predicted transcriptional regulator